MVGDVTVGLCLCVLSSISGIRILVFGNVNNSEVAYVVYWGKVNFGRRIILTVSTTNVVPV